MSITLKEFTQSLKECYSGPVTYESEKMKLKVKKLHPEAVMPTKGTEFSAGWDITALDCEIIEENNLSTIVYKTGIAVQLPPGHVGLLVPRSSLSKNTTLMLQNHCGILDQDYTGEILFKFRDFINNVPNRAFTHSKKYEVNERIGQLVIVPIPELELELVDELDQTVRADKGHGSTGR